MYSIITGSLLLSILHAAIPNHWLPVLAIGRKENWSLTEITRVTFITALAHGLSTIILGWLLSFIGAGMAENVAEFTQWMAPALLIILGLYFMYRHHVHKHFHLHTSSTRKKTKNQIIGMLTLAMFFSPCLEIEAYFLLAGAYGYWLIGLISIMYLGITTAGMVLWVRLAYKGVLKLNWHRLEHSAGVITGIVLVLTGILTFFVH